MHYLATKLFDNIPLNINNLNHDIQEFLRHRLSVSIKHNLSRYRDLPSLKIK